MPKRTTIMWQAFRWCHFFEIAVKTTIYIFSYMTWFGHFWKTEALDSFFPKILLNAPFVKKFRVGYRKKSPKNPHLYLKFRVKLSWGKKSLPSKGDFRLYKKNKENESSRAEGLRFTKDINDVNIQYCFCNRDAYLISL